MFCYRAPHCHVCGVCMVHFCVHHVGAEPSQVTSSFTLHHASETRSLTKPGAYWLPTVTGHQALESCLSLLYPTSGTGNTDMLPLCWGSQLYHPTISPAPLILLLFACFWDKYVAQAGLEFESVLPRNPEYWNYRHVPPHPSPKPNLGSILKASVDLLISPRMGGIQSLNWGVISPIP